MHLIDGEECGAGAPLWAVLFRRSCVFRTFALRAWVLEFREFLVRRDFVFAQGAVNLGALSGLIPMAAVWPLRRHVESCALRARVEEMT